MQEALEAIDGRVTNVEDDVAAIIAADAPKDGTTYGRRDGSWSDAIDMGTF